MLAIRNGRVLSDVGEAEPADVLIDGEEIVHVGQLGASEANGIARLTQSIVSSCLG